MSELTGARPIPAINGRTTFRQALHGEWTKLRTLRSTSYVLLAALVLGAGMAVLFSSGSAERYAELTAAKQDEFDPVGTSQLGGIMFAQLALGVLGVLSVSTEYGTGMMSTSLTAVPRRRRLFLAKAALVAGVGLVLGEIIGLLAFVLGQPTLAEANAPHAALGDPGALRAVIGTGIYLALVAVLGLATGFLVRSTAGAITLLIVMTLIIPFFFGPLLPGVVQVLWPVMAGLQVTMTGPATGMGPWFGIGFMLVGVGGVLAASSAAFRRRDA